MWLSKSRNSPDEFGKYVCFPIFFLLVSQASHHKVDLCQWQSLVLGVFQSLPSITTLTAETPGKSCFQQLTSLT